MANGKRGGKKGEYDVFSLVQTPIAVISKDWDVKFVNDSGLSLLGKDIDDAVGKKCYNLMRTDHCQTDECACKRAMEQDVSISAQTISRALGDIDMKYFATPVKNESGEIIGCVETVFDITEVTKLQEKSIQMAREILEVSTPIVTVFDDILTLPIIGTLDSERTQRMTESLLQAVVDTQSRVVIIDVTGVSVMDTLTATHLLKTAEAVRLLGATAIVTGISPTVAQTLVQLGVDLSQLMTRAQMIEGVKSALELLSKKVVSIE
jgi:rsbT co-antagonist protein RsbR